MKNIVIYGAGGFGKEVASLLKRINKVTPTWNLLGFVDDDIENKPIGSSNEYGVILGNSEYLNNISEPMSVILALGKPKHLKKAYEKITNPLIEFPNIVAPEATILDCDNFSMGKGNILCSFASMSCNVRLGDFNVFNNRCSVGHDATIGNFNTFMTASRISGSTKIGSLNFFGVSAIVLPELVIGTGVTIAAGAVLMKKTKDNTTYVGNPAKKFEF